MAGERRRHPRRAAAWSASWIAARGAGAGEVCDVSEGGLGLRTSRGVRLPEPGDVLHLSVVIRPDVILTPVALVANTHPEGRVGVAFSQVSSADAFILRQYAEGRGVP